MNPIDDDSYQAWCDEVAEYRDDVLDQLYGTPEDDDDDE